MSDGITITGCERRDLYWAHPHGPQIDYTVRPGYLAMTIAADFIGHHPSMAAWLIGPGLWWALGIAALGVIAVSVINMRRGA